MMCCMSYKEEYYKKIESFISTYQSNGKPIAINFRQLMPEVNGQDRYTHLIHPYPAKLLYHIPYFFLRTDYFCPANGIVLDPFCGTGTVLLESNLSGRSALGADANPLAVLISKVKTTYLAPDVLMSTLEHLLYQCKRSRYYIKEDTSSIERWFSASTIEQLGKLEKYIGQIDDEYIREFFTLCLSSVVKKVSFCDPRVSVPVQLNPQRFANDSNRRNELEAKLAALQNVDVYEKFEIVCKANINRVATIKEIAELGVSTQITSRDARRITQSLDSDELLPNESVDMILTSPPYAGAQKYIRSSWLNLYWLGVKDQEQRSCLHDKNIGRENYQTKLYKTRIETGIASADTVLHALYEEGKNERAYIVGNYLNEMKIALDESVRVLKKGGYMVIVIGNNTVCGRPFDTQDYLSTYLEQKGMQIQFKLVDDIKSYGLMTKRNKTASLITCEWVLVFRKE